MVPELTEVAGIIGLERHSCETVLANQEQKLTICKGYGDTGSAWFCCKKSLKTVRALRSANSSKT